MVRVNLVDPKELTDQHLIAEYNEILMLLGYVRKHPGEEGIPREFCLGKGHVKFFKNKLTYLKNRHESLKDEMIRRGFKPTKSVSLDEFPDSLKMDWCPSEKDRKIIRKRISEKIEKKPGFYRHCGKKLS